MCPTTRRPSPSGSRMSVRHRSNGSLSSRRIASATDSAREVSRPMRDNVSSKSSSRSGSSSTTSTFGWPRILLVMKLPFKLPSCQCTLRRQRALERHPEMRAGSLGQKLERGAVGVGELARDVKAEPGPAGPGGEERLEDLRPKLRGDARAVVHHFADDGVAHVARARAHAHAAFLLFAMLA